MVGQWPLLSLLIWVPILGGIGVLAAGNDNADRARWTALAVAVVTLGIGLALWLGFESGIAGMQFVEKAAWIRAFDIHYHLGVDGISMPLVVLTAFSTLLVIGAAWEVVRYKPAQYLAAFLIMEGIMIGVFSALDAILFYVFFEAMLIPMFLIIGIRGGTKRIYGNKK